MFSTIRSIEKVNYWVFKFDLNVPFVLHVGQVTHLSQVLHVRNIAILSKNICDNLTATEINILWKQEKKNIKTVIRCRDGRPKVCKQGRNDVKVKVNIQSPIPTTFYTIQLHFTVRKLQGWGFVYSPSLLYLYHPYSIYILFGMPSLLHLCFWLLNFDFAVVHLKLFLDPELWSELWDKPLFIWWRHVF